MWWSLKKAVSILILTLLACSQDCTGQIIREQATNRRRAVGAEAAHTWEACSRETKDPRHNKEDVSDLLGPQRDLLLFDFRDDVDPQEIYAFASREGFGALVRLPSDHIIHKNLWSLEVPEGSLPKIRAHLEAKYGKDGLLESVDEEFRVQAFGLEFDLDTSLSSRTLSPYIRKASTRPSTSSLAKGEEPDDPLYQYQWHLNQIQAQEAWDLSTGQGAVVAVIDTGVSMGESAIPNRLEIKDLEGTRWVQGYDFVDMDDDPWDTHGHGTHVAGTIAQTTNNAYGVAGVAHGSAIMPLRVLDSNGYGKTSDTVAAIYYAVDHHATVINMSLGSSESSEAEERAVQYAVSRSVVVVAAAGNSGNRERSYPAAYPAVFSIAATQFDEKTAFYSQWGSTMDFAAPGGNTRVDQNKDGKPDGVLQETLNENRDAVGFQLYMGTSMATPHVAATVALLNQYGITNPARVRRFLEATTSTSARRGDSISKAADDDDDEDEDDDDDKTGDPDKWSDKEYRERFGAGIVQAHDALVLAIVYPSVVRSVAGLLLALFIFGMARERDFATVSVRLLGFYLLGAALVVSGIFGAASTCLAGYLPNQVLTTLVGGPLMLLNIYAGVNAPWLMALLLYGSLKGVAETLPNRHRDVYYHLQGVSLGIAAWLAVEAVWPCLGLMWPLSQSTSAFAASPYLKGTLLLLISFGILRGVYQALRGSVKH